MLEVPAQYWRSMKYKAMYLHELRNGSVSGRGLPQQCEGGMNNSHRIQSADVDCPLALTHLRIRALLSRIIAECSRFNRRRAIDADREVLYRWTTSTCDHMRLLDNCVVKGGSVCPREIKSAISIARFLMGVLHGHAADWAYP